MKKYLPILLLVLVSFGVLTIGLNKPLNGHHDWNDRYFSAIALNYLHYGPLQLGFGQLIGDSLPIAGNFYTHHPQLFPLILSAAILILGNHNWVIRLTPIIFSVSTVAIFYLLLKKYFSWQAAFLACLFMIATPMFLYFGKMADHEAFTLFFIILTIYFYLNNNFKLTLLALFLGQWTGWPAYYLAGFLFLWSRKPVFLILSLVNFSLFLLNIQFLTGSIFGGGLSEVFFFRMGFINLPSVHEEYTNWQLLSQELHWLYRFIGPPQVILALLAFIYSLKNRPKFLAVWMIFGAVAVTHVVLFRTGAWRHDYWLYYFLPFFSFGIAAGISVLEKKGSVIYTVYIAALVLMLYMTQPFFWALQNMIDTSL